MEVSIIEYRVAVNTSELLQLLLELHATYFTANASSQIQELNREKDIRQSYQDYITGINEDSDNWKVLLAFTREQQAIGFITGSITNDENLVRNRIGKLEDWYVTESYRAKGVGMQLYNILETWFKQQGCTQVLSETWHGNTLSLKAHEQLGFFVSGVAFGKTL